MKLTKSLVVTTYLSLLAPLSSEIVIVVGEPATQAVNEPFSIDFDSKGNLYGVEFCKSNRIFKLADGKLEFIAGENHNTEKDRNVADIKDGGDPFQAHFNGMHDIRLPDDGHLIIADSFNHCIRRMDLESGEISTIAGTGQAGFGGDGGIATRAKFNITMTSSLSPDGKRIHIADINNHRIREIDLEGNTVRTIAGNGKKGNPTDGANALESPMGDARAVVEAKDGTLYVLLRGGNSLVAIKDGKARTVVNASGKKGYSGDGGDARQAMMNGPKYVDMDAEGNVLICDTENHCIRRFNPSTGNIELVAGSPGKAGDKIGKDFLHTQLKRPHGLRIGPKGELFIADTYNNRILSGDDR